MTEDADIAAKQRVWVMQSITLLCHGAGKTARRLYDHEMASLLPDDEAIFHSVAAQLAMQREMPALEPRVYARLERLFYKMHCVGPRSSITGDIVAEEFARTCAQVRSGCHLEDAARPDEREAAARDSITMTALDPRFDAVAV